MARTSEDNFPHKVEDMLSEERMARGKQVLLGMVEDMEVHMEEGTLVSFDREEGTLVSFDMEEGTLVSSGMEEGILVSFDMGEGTFVLDESAVGKAGNP